jgi:hypothetical protein
MARRQLVAGGERLGGDRPLAGVDRDVDHRGDSKNILARHQRHFGTDEFPVPMVLK